MADKQGVSPQIINKFYKAIRRHSKTFARLAITARLGGYAIAEYVYAQDDDGFIYLDKVLDKDGELDRFAIRADGSVIYQSTTDIAVNTKVKVLALTHNACAARPMGQMSIVKIYPAVLLRAKGFAYAGQFIARYAQPYVVGKQGGYSMMENFTTRLFEFINGGAIGIGTDDDISIHELSGTGDAFATIEELANKRIQKFLLGRSKTSELSVGSRSAQETDDKVRNDRIGGYLELMTEAIQHAIDAMLAVNNAYGMPINAKEGLWFEYVSEQGVDTERAARDKLYLDTGQITLTREYMIDMVGFEAHHFKLIDEHQDGLKDELPKQTKLSNTPMRSIQLSSEDNNKDDSNEHSFHTHLDDEPLTDTQLAIGAAKERLIQDMLDSSQDFTSLEKRLKVLNLADDDFIKELHKEGLGEYLKGFVGVINA